jgi:hypothetical protein
LVVAVATVTAATMCMMANSASIAVAAIPLTHLLMWRRSSEQHPEIDHEHNRSSDPGWRNLLFGGYSNRTAKLRSL